MQQWNEHELQRFGCITERSHAPHELIGLVPRRGVAGFQVGQLNTLFSQPIAIGAAISADVFDFFVVSDAAEFEVDQEHPARLEPPF